ncbi:aminopeptidase P family protein [Sphingomonas colocasiae]|uniref:Aminopeptidase P family protein n=1 Tax=Sphingomonas colocasiae TaxID=1848973 RepID=A0ABS7PQ14_9SPHN|nr:aminopeptidase P family protein [Sphingomonas colocasiae]MBY8823422.1 aminopeptidase P family protein [Sphingomonas colocasiae]
MNNFGNRLVILRKMLVELDLDGFMLSTGDAHMTEWPAAFAQRLAWLTGFTGTTGMAAVLAGRAAMFVDGRYTAAVRNQVDGGDYGFVDLAQTGIGDWLARNAEAGARIGYDPTLHGCDAVRKIEHRLAGSGMELVPLAANPIDGLWVDRPERPKTPLFVQPVTLSGRTTAGKLDDVTDWLASSDADAVVLVALDSIAWLFNIRASDIPVAPLGYAFAICRRDGSADLYIDTATLSDEVRNHLGDRVRLAGYDDFYPALEALTGQCVSIDPDLSPIAIHQALSQAGAKVREDVEPTLLAKQIKNVVEIEGMRQAHVRDGVAVTRFLHWLSTEGPKGNQTELSAAGRMTAFRRELAGFHGVSFDPISAADASAALPHYWPTPASNRPIRPGSVFLIDSGGQYPDGTTDITRTVTIGTPRAEVKDRFTRVLKGHIRLAATLFPAGTLGSRLDPVARLALWEAGLDYAHGTGHGVGHFLNVHEGPNHLPAGPRPGETGIQAGMILSNEPGYYKAGDYGIRIENLVVAVKRDVLGAEQPLLGFETISLAPIDRALIDIDLLSDAEIAWLDRYHARVLARIGPLVPSDTRRWLEQATAPLRPDARSARVADFGD